MNRTHSPESRKAKTSTEEKKIEKKKQRKQEIDSIRLMPRADSRKKMSMKVLLHCM